jgi:hypothetical protein
MKNEKAKPQKSPIKTDIKNLKATVNIECEAYSKRIIVLLFYGKIKKEQIEYFVLQTAHVVL